MLCVLTALAVAISLQDKELGLGWVQQQFLQTVSVAVATLGLSANLIAERGLKLCSSSTVETCQLFANLIPERG